MNEQRTNAKPSSAGCDQADPLPLSIKSLSVVSCGSVSYGQRITWLETDRPLGMLPRDVIGDDDVVPRTLTRTALPPLEILDKANAKVW